METRELIKLIKSLVHNFRTRYCPSDRISTDGELAWDVYTHFVEKGYFDKYDPAKIKDYVNFILVGVRNFLIDRERYLSRRKCVYISFLEDSEGKENFERVYGKEDEVRLEVVIEQIMSVLRSRFSELGLEGKFVLEGEVRSRIYVSDIVYMVMVGYSLSEISDKLNVPYHKIKLRYDKAVGYLKKVYKI